MCSSVLIVSYYLYTCECSLKGNYRAGVATNNQPVLDPMYSPSQPAHPFMRFWCTGAVRERQCLGVALSKLKNNGEAAADSVSRHPLCLLDSLSSWKTPGVCLPCTTNVYCCSAEVVIACLRELLAWLHALNPSHFVYCTQLQGARPRTASTNGSSAATSANDTSKASEQQAETSGYAIRPIPINDIEAFRKHTPSIGTHHVAIVMRDGSVRVCPDCLVDSFAFPYLSSLLLCTVHTYSLYTFDLVPNSFSCTACS